MKSIDTVVEDIYNLVETNDIPEGVDVDKVLDDLANNIKSIIKSVIVEPPEDKRTVRMSNIGKKDRQLWYLHKGVKGEPLMPHTRIKFLYGHFIEEMVLALVKLSGHKVTDEQKKVEVAGIRGSMDCKIDGTLIDVKSTSSYGFKKFKDGTLINDDPFGYVDQIKGYAEAEKAKEFGWLAMDKTNGHLTVLKYDMEDESKPYWTKLNFFRILDRIKYIKKLIMQDKPPERCYEPEPDGKSGNMKLGLGCSYCQYKHECYPELRTFLYANGPRYLTKVVKKPDVIEVDRDGNKV